MNPLIYLILNHTALWVKQCFGLNPEACSAHHINVVVCDQVFGLKCYFILCIIGQDFAVVITDLQISCLSK